MAGIPTPSVRTDRGGQRIQPSTTAPVKVWAVVGGAVLVFIGWVLLRWVTGPYFKAVPSGPSEPPGWMKANLVFWQVVSPLAALGLIYWFVVRPWLRDRRIGVDGVLIIAFLTLWFQDPLCNLAGSWVTYNTWMTNMGSWHASVPGSVSFAAPGQMLAEPLLLIPALYVYFFWLAAIGGCWVMRRIGAHWPHASKVWLIAGCFAAIAVFDFVLEGLIWMPGGAWSLPGGQLPVLFAGTYHQFTINEFLPVSATLTAVACIRHFRDDRGRMLAERGVDDLKISSNKRLGLRILAVVGIVHVAMFACYTMPNLIFGMNARAWPADVQKRSYLTDYICGDGTDRTCPGPQIPNLRNNNQIGGSGSAWITWDGSVGRPAGAPLSQMVPFEK
jgi:hypothetical protein